MCFNDVTLDPNKPKIPQKTALFERRATRRVALDPGNGAFESPSSPVSKTFPLAKKRANWASWQLATSGDPPPGTNKLIRQKELPVGHGAPARASYGIRGQGGGVVFLPRTKGPLARLIPKKRTRYYINEQELRRLPRRSPRRGRCSSSSSRRRARRGRARRGGGHTSSRAVLGTVNTIRLCQTPQVISRCRGQCRRLGGRRGGVHLLGRLVASSLEILWPLIRESSSPLRPSSHRRNRIAHQASQ